MKSLIYIVLIFIVVVGASYTIRSLYTKPNTVEVIEEHKVFVNPDIPIDAPKPLTEAEEKVQYECLMLNHRKSFKNNKELSKKCKELTARWIYYNDIQANNRVLKLILDMENLDKQGPQ